MWDRFPGRLCVAVFFGAGLLQPVLRPSYLSVPKLHQVTQHPLLTARLRVGEALGLVEAVRAVESCSPGRVAHRDGREDRSDEPPGEHTGAVP